jgi:hypothetical protein
LASVPVSVPAPVSVSIPAPVSVSAPVPDPFSDALALEALEKRITTLAARIHAATHRLLVLIAEFDRRQGWKLGGHKSCAHFHGKGCQAPHSIPRSMGVTSNVRFVANHHDLEQFLVR